MADVLLVGDLAEKGFSAVEIARLARIPYPTVAQWLRSGIAAVVSQRARTQDSWTALHDPQTCVRIATLPPIPYLYLLGLYLGDGWIGALRKGVYALRITCCDQYPGLMDRCQQAIEAVMPANRVGRYPGEGCTDVISTSKHWPCLLPQHGPGKKHLRPIVLTEWQTQMAARHPEALLAALIHSDGCRCSNQVRKGDRSYAYTRYFFKQQSTDIIGIFTWCCDLLGVEWRMNNPNSVSIAKRASVEFLDTFVGPKR